MDNSERKNNQMAAITKKLVQRLAKPDPEINSEYPLFFHHEKGVAGFDSERGVYFAEYGSTIRFNSYFNAFPAHLYELDDHGIEVELNATGTFFVQVIMARHGRSWERAYQKDKTFLGEDESITIPLPKIDYDGVLYVELIAISDIVINEIDYNILGEPHQNVTLTGVITTFKRDAAVQQTGNRLQRYFEDNPDLLEKFQLLVVDNGGDTDSVPFSKGKVIKNYNLGGSGGFTRGLLEVFEKKISSHVLFMDDDASFFPESLRRTISVLQFSKASNRAVSGAMITEAHKWRMWENGATFNRCCRPIDNGRDLRDFNEVLSMSAGQPRNLDNKYAGWWYFCFPVNSVDVWPFPFFVRGDDSYFSLSNNFEIITVPGVVAIQEDFFTKQSPLTLYLDIRYHIVHHLTFDSLEIGRKEVCKLVARFFHRFNNSYHYESAAAICQAIEDVLQGDTFWEQNLDMAERRKLINEFTNNEKIKNGISIDSSDVTHHSPRRNKSGWKKILRRFSFNGHVLPAFFYYKKGVSFPLDLRAIEHDTFLRPFTITMDQATGKGYVCQVSKKSYFENLKRFKGLYKRLDAEYPELRKTYASASQSLTKKDVWAKRFGVE